ncbi:MAG: substrate-binding domain-containing protein [Alphaproteobacteria bacterium]
MKGLKATLAAAALGAVAFAGSAEARDQINIVGSSTVFPFSTAVAETFGRTTSFPTPVVESTGSGGGLRLFCAGVGVEHPDITNASRRIKSSEVETCAENGVTDIVEIKVGYDGIVLGNSVDAEQVELTMAQLFLALAAQVPDGNGNIIENPYERWSDIDPSLPNYEIEVLGPPPSSGTRDAFVELAMEGGARQIEQLAELRSADKDAFEEIAHTLREDGRFIEAGENDNLIVQKLTDNPEAFGIFGFSFLDQNSDLIQGSVIDGNEPTFEAIAAGDYSVSRSLYFYVKSAHVGVIPGIEEYLAEFTSEGAWGPDGYLAERGLIPMPDEERQTFRAAAENLSSLSM